MLQQKSIPEYLPGTYRNATETSHVESKGMDKKMTTCPKQNPKKWKKKMETSLTGMEKNMETITILNWDCKGMGE